MDSIRYVIRLAVLLTGTILCGLSFAGPSFSIPAPVPPAILYRLDFRDPTDFFVNGVPFAENQNYPEKSDDLLEHIKGRGFRSNPGSNWTSATADFDHIRYWLASLSAMPAPPPYLWVYEIQPTAKTYSLHWAVTEFLIRNVGQQSERLSGVRVVHDRPSDPQEWAIFEGVEPSDIYRATRWDYQPASGHYTAEGSNLVNLKFTKRPLPGASTNNPLDDFPPTPEAELGIDERIFALMPELSAAAKVKGTMIEPLNTNLGCTGDPVAVDGQTNHRYESTACPTDWSQIMLYAPAALARPSVLAFQFRGLTQCLSPKLNNGYVGAGFVKCDGFAPKFEYDEYQRLNVQWKKSNWCMSAPSSVVDESKPAWDYVKFEPCTVNSTYQKWSIIKGELYSYKGHVRLQEFRVKAVLSKSKDGNRLRIKPTDMAPGFFDGPSPSRSHQVEVQMGWSWKGSHYYSNTKSTAPWSENYWDRSYYDYNRQTISYIHLGSTALASHVPATKYCLSSRQESSQTHRWDWTDWVECNDADVKVPPSSKWDFRFVFNEPLDPSRIEWRDLKGNPLWAQATTYSHAGSYFTKLGDSTQDYSYNSVRTFSMRPDAIRVGKRFDPQSSVPDQTGNQL